MFDIPHSLADLLQMAYTDWLEVSQWPGYAPCIMNSCHSIQPSEGLCEVSLQGAVIAKRMGMPRERECDWEDFKPPHRHALRAIEFLEVGNLRRAAFSLRDALGRRRTNYDTSRVCAIDYGSPPIDADWISAAKQHQRIVETITILRRAEEGPERRSAMLPWLRLMASLKRRSRHHPR